MNNLIYNLFNSFNLKADGFSARKLSAFWAIVTTNIIELAWLCWALFAEKGNWELLTTIITINLGFAAAALGMTTYQAVKTGKENTITDGIQK